MKKRTLLFATLLSLTMGLSGQSWVEGIYNPKTNDLGVDRSRLRFNEAFKIPLTKKKDGGQG